jgi:hypothetical protein
VLTEPQGILDEDGLRNYIDSDTVHKYIFQSMRDVRLDYDLGGATLSLNTYHLDLDHLHLSRTFGIHEVEDGYGWLAQEYRQIRHDAAYSPADRFSGLPHRASLD